MELCCLLLLKSGQKSKNSLHHGDAVFEKKCGIFNSRTGIAVANHSKNKTADYFAV